MDVHGSPRRAALCSAAGGSHRALFVPPRVKKASATLATTNMSRRWRGEGVTAPREVPADSSLAHLDAELEKFAVDARRAPESGFAHPTDQGPDGTSGTA